MQWTIYYLVGNKVEVLVWKMYPPKNIKARKRLDVYRIGLSVTPTCFLQVLTNSFVIKFGGYAYCWHIKQLEEFNTKSLRTVIESTDKIVSSRKS